MSNPPGLFLLYESVSHPSDRDERRLGSFFRFPDALLPSIGPAMMT